MTPEENPLYEVPGGRVFLDEAVCPHALDLSTE
jgi:hypothetical protein